MNQLPPKYVIDSCSLILLKEVYPPDVFLPVWETISEMAECGAIISCEEIFDELEAQEGEDDIVLKWAREHRSIFYPMDEATQKTVLEILANHPNLLDLKKSKSSGDPFLIAIAIKYDCTVVSDEKPSGGPGKVKIPDVCRFYEVKCIKLLDLLRAEGLKLTSNEG